MQSEQRELYLSLLRRLRGMQSVANSGILRAPSRSENSEAPKKPGYYTFFCIHAKHKWSPCRQCKRSKREADAAREKYRMELSQLLS